MVSVCGFSHFSPVLSLCVCPPSSLPVVVKVYSNTTGCTEPLGMKSHLISDGQLSSSSAFRTWGIDAFTWHAQFGRLDKQGKTNAWSAATNNRAEWLQVGGNQTRSNSVTPPAAGRHLTCMWLSSQPTPPPAYPVTRWTWRNPSASQASSRRELRTLGWCSTCPFSKWPTATMGRPGAL